MPRTYDAVAEEVAPLLVHLGEVGVAPEVHRAVERWEEPEFLNEGIDAEVPYGATVRLEIEEVPGERWSTALVDRDLDEAVDVARQVGEHAGYIAGRVAHRDLHADNVWVDGDRPVITDWGMAYREDAGADDMQRLIDHTGDVLEREGLEDRYGPVREAYVDGFRDRAGADWGVTGEELRADYEALF